MVKEVVSDVVYQADSRKVTITFVTRQGDVSSENGATDDTRGR